MGSVTATVDDKAARALFARLGALGRDTSKATRAASLAMKQAVYATFRAGAGPDGIAWPALKPATLAARRRRGNASIQPLVDTGAMYASIEAANTATEASVSIGVGLPDARAFWNQFGTDTAPARRFVPITKAGHPDPGEAWMRTVLAPVKDAIDKAVKEAST